VRRHDRRRLRRRVCGGGDPPAAALAIVLVGLLGKVLGPIGFVQAAVAEQLPWRFGWTILSNDLVWWPAFGAILWQAWRAAHPRPRDRKPRSSSPA